MWRLVFLIATGTAAMAALAHCVVFGPRRVDTSAGERPLRRFSVWERLVHLLTMVSFLVLAATGAGASIGYEIRLTGWWWVVHVAAAPVFALSFTALVLTWAHDCRFARHDWDWAKQFGGYLRSGRAGHGIQVPAARFNCGQKEFFWGVAVLALAVVVSGLLLAVPLFGERVQAALFLAHRYAAMLCVVFVIAHFYLATAANPGTLWSIFSGKVDANWARHHHPLWWKSCSDETQES